ncbi:hypothetical protein CGU36_27705, partial [Pseudomonas fluorescens]
MTDTTYPPSAEFAANALINADKYREMYAASINDSDAFWRDHVTRLDWATAPTVMKNVTYAHPDVSIKWFEDGALNVAANCIDRHLAERADQTAIIWESDDPNVDKHITYRELH